MNEYLVKYQNGDVYGPGWHTIKAGKLPIVMLVRDGAVLPHIKLAQCTDQMDWNKLTLKVYTADSKEAEGLICLPADNILQTVKVDCSAGKPRLESEIKGTKVSF